MPAPTTVAPAASTSARSARSDVTTVVAGDDELADAVVGGVAAAPRGVAHRDDAVVALGQVGLRHVEHEHHRLAEALQPGEQPAHGAPGGRATSRRRRAPITLLPSTMRLMAHVASRETWPIPSSPVWASPS